MSGQRLHRYSQVADIVYRDNYCVIVKSNDPTEPGLSNTRIIAEMVWATNVGDSDHYTSWARSEDYGKRIFYIYCNGDASVEILIKDVDDGSIGHPLLIDKGVVMIPFTEIMEIAEYVLFEALTQ